VLATTHGADPAPPSAVSDAQAGAELPLSYGSRYVTFTDERDIRCRDTTQNRVLAVYTYLSGSSNRVETFKADIRAQVRRINYFLNENSLRTSSTDPQVSDYRVECNDGYIRVAAVASSGRSLSATVDSLINAGYDNEKVKYLMVADYMSASSAPYMCGQGEAFSDDNRSVNNPNNAGPMFSIVWRNCWDYSDVYMHELSHTMGAVQHSANHASGAFHCNDGLDVMCYDDNGPTSNYSSAACSVLRLDCGANDYFDTDTSPGQYLHSSWNIGWTENRFIYTRPQ
jgi:hypothetical protein